MAEAEAPIHGDILEVIFSHVPLIHLPSASHISKSWSHAVSSSLAHLNPIKPWLFLHAHSNTPPHVITTHAYDPRSHLWLRLPHPVVTTHASPLRSSHSSLLYVLSLANFSFSFDPLHLTWHHVHAPRVWRIDPVVARVGQRVVVAGGACDFEDDPLAVEIYDLETCAWRTCQSMPARLKNSTARTWLSVAVDEHRMLVTERNSGLTYSLDPKTEMWQGPYDVRPDESVYPCVTGILEERLIVAGLVGDAENVRSVKLWGVRGDLGNEYWWEEMGEMPKEMVKKVKGKEESVSSIEMETMGDLVFIHNPSETEEVVIGEMVNGTWKWESVENVLKNDARIMQRMVVSCSHVTMEDLETAMSENPSFADKIWKRR